MGNHMYSLIVFLLNQIFAEIFLYNILLYDIKKGLFKNGILSFSHHICMDMGVVKRLIKPLKGSIE